MAIEKFWPEVPVQLFTQDGGQYGQITIPSTKGLKTKQRVIVISNIQPPKELEIKRVLSDTNLEVGPIGPEMESREDLRLYLTSQQSGLFAKRQSRPSIIPDQYNRAVYEEEPTVAVRSFLVDWLGRGYSTDNPIPVQLTDGSINIGSLNADLEVQLSHKDNFPDSGDVADSVRIGDGVRELKVNPDGSINVIPIDPTSVVQEDLISSYNEVSSVASGVVTTILTFVAPIGKTTYLNKIDYSGDNVSKYEVQINGTTIDKQRTFFGSSLNGTFNFSNGSKGLKLEAGDEVKLLVVHQRPSLGDFSGRIQTLQS